MMLYELAGVMFIIAAFVGKNYVFVPIGICFALQFLCRIKPVAIATGFCIDIE